VLQAALKESETETRSLRKYLLTVVHHVQSSVKTTALSDSLNVACEQRRLSTDVLCDKNRGKREWSSDVKETERIIDALTTHLRQQQREIAGANLKIHLLEQSARILKPRPQSAQAQSLCS